MLEDELQIKELEAEIDRMLDSNDIDKVKMDLLLDELDELLANKYSGPRLVK